MKEYEYTLSHTKLSVINKVANLLDNFKVSYEITKECEDVTIFSIHYDDFSDCENSQELAEKLEDLAIRYDM